MPSRNDYKFILLPWEHQGTRFDPRPDAITHLYFAGANLTVLLKAKADRLFFRFADWSLDPWCRATFAVTTPFLANIRQAELFFHEAMERNQVARYATMGYTHQIQGITTLLWLINEKGAPQTGWAREWCGGDWIAWEVSSYLDYSIWDEQWHPGFPAATYDPIWPTIAHRRFTEAERQNIATHWERGSREELSQLLRAYFCLFPDAAREVNEHLEEWGEYGATGSTQVRAWAWNAATSTAFLRSTLWNNTGVGRHCELMGDVAPRWADLITQHNYAVGLTWHHNGKGDTERRENWWCETPTFDLDVPLPFSYPPSQHEQMEARLFLRDWLRDKVPADEIEAWLSSDEVA